MLNYFDNYICIDKRNKEELPDFLHSLSVPCIFIKDHKEPLNDEKSFKWLDFIKMKKANEEEKKSNINAFVFNNNFDDFDNINNKDNRKPETLNNSINLNMLEEPLIPEKERLILEKKYENKTFDERLQELEMERK
jgi:hypothetical protein